MDRFMIFLVVTTIGVAILYLFAVNRATENRRKEYLRGEMERRHLELKDGNYYAAGVTINWFAIGDRLYALALGSPAMKVMQANDDIALFLGWSDIDKIHYSPYLKEDE